MGVKISGVFLLDVFEPQKIFLHAYVCIAQRLFFRGRNWNVISCAQSARQRNGIMSALACHYGFGGVRIYSRSTNLDVTSPRRNVAAFLRGLTLVNLGFR